MLNCFWSPLLLKKASELLLISLRCISDIGDASPSLRGSTSSFQLASYNFGFWLLLPCPRSTVCSKFDYWQAYLRIHQLYLDQKNFFGKIWSYTFTVCNFIVLFLITDSFSSFCPKNRSYLPKLQTDFSASLFVKSFSVSENDYFPIFVSENDYFPIFVSENDYFPIFVSENDYFPIFVSENDYFCILGGGVGPPVHLHARPLAPERAHRGTLLIRASARERLHRRGLSCDFFCLKRFASILLWNASQCTYLRLCCDFFSDFSYRSMLYSDIQLCREVIGAAKGIGMCFLWREVLNIVF